jgi:uncharacterized protein (TIGR00299 family) protein
MEGAGAACAITIHSHNPNPFAAPSLRQPLREALRPFTFVIQMASLSHQHTLSSGRRRDTSGAWRPYRYNSRRVPIICYLDAFSGISGDMLVGALADAGADPAAIADAVASLNAGATVSFEKVKRAGIGATKYHVHVKEQHAHRHLSHIVQMIEKAPLPERVQWNAIAIFRRLAEAEAEVHRVSVEKVHFHEVGAADSIADIVGACVALDQLRAETVVCSPVNVGSGTVDTEHGILPVPAPATARLLANVPVYSRGPAFELTTPTGAAAAVTLSSRFSVMPPMKIQKAGYGAGGHDFPGQANVLRVLLGEPARVEEALAVDVIEANIDDLNPQVLAYAAERLMNAGALDVTLSPLVMKKGRPGNLLRVIAKPEHRELLIPVIFSETSTFGLRIYSAERRVRARRWEEVETPYGKVRMKISEDGGYSPEYEDCRKLSEAAGVALKHVIAEANYAYLNRSR